MATKFYSVEPNAIFNWQERYPARNDLAEAERRLRALRSPPAPARRQGIGTTAEDRAHAKARWAAERSRGRVI